MTDEKNPIEEIVKGEPTIDSASEVAEISDMTANVLVPEQTGSEVLESIASETAPAMKTIDFYGSEKLKSAAKDAKKGINQLVSIVSGAYSTIQGKCAEIARVSKEIALANKYPADALKAEERYVTEKTKEAKRLTEKLSKNSIADHVKTLSENSAKIESAVSADYEAKSVKEYTKAIVDAAKKIDEGLVIKTEYDKIIDLAKKKVTEFETVLDAKVTDYNRMRDEQKAESSLPKKAELRDKLFTRDKEIAITEAVIEMYKGIK